MTRARKYRSNRPIRRTSSPQVSFEQRLQELEEYKKENGHCRVPHLYSKNKSLGWWVSTVRKFLKTGNEPYLTKERIDKLNKIGFGECILVNHLPNIRTKKSWHFALSLSFL